MEKPNLDRMWETFIKISSKRTPQGNEIILTVLYDLIRFKISPLTSNLIWYHFLIHNKESGVPTSEDDDNAYLHIRFEPKNPDDFLNSLPDYCVMTRKVNRKWVEQISIGKGITFDTSRLKHEKIEEVWRIIGEQSEWFINMLNISKEDVEISILHVNQFLHYFSNMAQMPIR